MVELDSNMIELDSNGLNINIQSHILSGRKMKKAGFKKIEISNNYYWFYQKWIDEDITFTVTIPLDNSRLRVEVWDEVFGQYYDYQHVLKNNPKNKIANGVKEIVEQEMARLQNIGILSGHKYGDYI